MAKKRNSTKKSGKPLRHSIVIIIALTVVAVVFFAYQRLGVIGLFLDRVSIVLFGERRDVFYAVIAIYALYRAFFKKPFSISLKHKLIFLVFFLLVFLGTAFFTIDPEMIGWEAWSTWFGRIPDIFLENSTGSGGLFGVSLYSLSTYLIDRLGTLIFMVLSGLLGLIFLLDFRKVRDWFTREVEETYDEPQPKRTIEPSKPSGSIFLNIDKEPAPKNKPLELDVKTKSAATIHTIGNYALPPVSLLDDIPVKSGKSSANSSAANIKGKRLIEILGEFDINAVLVATHIGPAVTKFEVRPDSNVKISKIASIQDNIKMELAAKELRIEAPIPGRNAVGVEIPNVEMIAVRMIEMMREVPNDKINKKLLFPLGKDLMGKAVFGEMDKMPHLLIAGATGSGKSVCVNSLIVHFLLRTSPDELKLLLIDPKKVEFTSYQKIPHLIGPVISDAAEAARALKIIVSMMENRYEVFSNVGVRNITTYNELIVKNPEKGLEPMPWIVVIIDELADLMIVAGKDVEASIQRITQLARAAGIHLIVATQRPSTDVITGIIKANIPSRIAFAVSSGIDSRTILDHIGAERLLGYGDMLFYPVGEPAPIRVQGVYTSDEEVRKVCEAVAMKQKPNFDEAFLNLSDPEAGTPGSTSLDDPMYAEVKDYVMETGRASTSNLQRRFGLGYNRAARMIDMLEQEGVVGPAQGSKPRDVYKHN